MKINKSFNNKKDLLKDSFLQREKNLAEMIEVLDQDIITKSKQDYPQDRINALVLKRDEQKAQLNNMIDNNQNMAELTLNSGTNKDDFTLDRTGKDVESILLKSLEAAYGDDYAAAINYYQKKDPNHQYLLPLKALRTRKSKLQNIMQKENYADFYDDLQAEINNRKSINPQDPSIKDLEYLRKGKLNKDITKIDLKKISPANWED